MAKPSGGKKKATVWYDTLVSAQPIVFKRVSRPANKAKRLGK